MALPTGEEQELLWLINRFRVDPAGEAARIIGGTGMAAKDKDAVANALYYFGVDKALFATQMATLTAAPPLAWNTLLEKAATGHSAAMIAADTQSHQLPGEADFGTRIKNAGYTYQSAGENIFAFAYSVQYAHAGFVIDWGAGAGGMQTPAGHRLNLIDAKFVEIGIDITHDGDGGNKVGPLVVTQDLAKPFSYVAQFVGAVFDDADGDNFYDAGEGHAGVTVTASGIGGTFTTTTWFSGGYQLAVPAGPYTVTFSDPILGHYETPATMAASNVEVDGEAAQFTLPLPVATLDPDRSVSESVIRITYSIRLDHAASIPALVHWHLEDGTARVTDKDMPAGQGGILNIAIGEASASFTLLVNDEAYKVEGTENFSVILDQPQGMTLGRAVASVSLQDNYVNPPLAPLAMTNTTTKINSTPSMTPYSGPLSYLDQEFIYLGTDGIALSASAPNVFLHSGSGDDAMAATAGQNVLDGGTGSNFLTGGAGADTFFLDARDPTFAIWSTVLTLSAGDAVTLWGISPSAYSIGWLENQGADGFKGLTMHATASGRANVSLTLASMTEADRTSGRFSVLFGTDPGSNSDYMYIFANF